VRSFDQEGGSTLWSQAWNFITGAAVSVEYESDMPSSFSLEQNFPNPFNPVTTIKFSIPSNVKGETANVKLKIYNVLGNEIATLVNDAKEAGYHSIDFNARDLPSAVYFYQLKAGSFVETKKMLLLK
jgi:hypothetical protein